MVYCTVQDETKTEELYLALKDNTLLLMAAMKQYADPINRINLLGGVVKLMNAHGQVGFQIDEVRDGSVVEQHIIWMQQESQRSQWHGSLERATVDGAIPSGITFTGTPSEYELCERLPEISETEVHLQKVSQRLLSRRQRCAWREACGSGDPRSPPHVPRSTTPPRPPMATPRCLLRAARPFCCCGSRCPHSPPLLLLLLLLSFPHTHKHSRLVQKNLLLKFRLCSIQFDLRNPQYGDAKDAKRTVRKAFIFQALK